MRQSLISLMGLYRIVKSKLSILLGIYAIIGLSVAYIVWNWPYTPQDALDDTQKLGAWGILIDVCLLLPIVIWWRRRRMAKTESLIYQRNESETIGDMNG